MLRHHLFKWLVGPALLVLMLSPHAAFAQTPPGVSNPVHSEFDANNPPAQFDEVILLLEVAPHAKIDALQFGGDQFVSVLEGTVNKDGKDIPVAGNYMQKAGEPHTLSNTGSNPARLVSTVLLPKGAALMNGEIPAGLTVVAQTQREFLTPPATFKVVQDVLQFAPGAGVPLHSHGGDVLGVVIQGVMTNHNGNVVTQIKSGEGFVENANQVHSIGNESDAPATFFGTILLPPGGEIITIQGAAPNTIPTTGVALDSLSAMSLALFAGVLLIVGGLLLRRRLAK